MGFPEFLVTDVPYDQELGERVQGAVMSIVEMMVDGEVFKNGETVCLESVNLALRIHELFDEERENMRTNRSLEIHPDCRLFKLFEQSSVLGQSRAPSSSCRQKSNVKNKGGRIYYPRNHAIIHYSFVASMIPS